VKGPAPLPGSILPAKRVIAYYGNPLSTRMGILGEFEPEVMLRKLDAEVAAWSRLDPAHPAQPALHLIVLVATPHPGPSGRYRTRHDSAMIEKVYGWARSRNALLFVDLQVGQSTLQYELPWIEKFLVRPDVHLGIDPEFSMKSGGVPGAAHRHLRRGRHQLRDALPRGARREAQAAAQDPRRAPLHAGGVTNARKIALDPRVQFVMHMDGFGPPVDEARHVLARHQARAGAVRRVEAVHEGEERPPAHAARRHPAALAGAALHPGPVAWCAGPRRSPRSPRPPRCSSPAPRPRPPTWCGWTARPG
jgi:hypothetical protein